MKEVQAINFEGDWYIIPNREVEEFNKLIELWYSLEYNYESFDCKKSDIDEKLNRFEEYKTGGDLNLIQLYIK